jgi:hypothetical protein
LAAGSQDQAAYRVIELTDVSDRAIEEALNRSNEEGYRFDSVHFAMQPGSRRPTMAFLFFARIDPDGRA